MDAGAIAETAGRLQVEESKREGKGEGDGKEKKKKGKPRGFVFPDVFELQDRICQETGEGCLPGQFELPSCQR